MTTAEAGHARSAAGTGVTRLAMAAIALGSLLFIASYALPNVGPLDRGKDADLAIYERYGNAILDGQAPYRDFFVLYPPGALPMFVLPAVGEHENYAVRFKWLEWLLGFATIAVVVAALGSLNASPRWLFGSAALVGIAPAALGESFVATFDIWPAFLTAAALAALLSGRDRLGFAVLAAGAATKLYPALILPIAFLYVRERAGTRRAVIGTGIFAAVALAIVAPFAVLSPGGLHFTLSIQEQRGLHIESLGAGILLAAHQLGMYHAQVEHYLDSQDLGGSLPHALAQASTAIQVIFVLAALAVAVRRRPDATMLVLGSATVIAAVVVFGKVVSHQYLIWLVPLVALALSRRMLPAAVLLGLALVVTQLWYPSRHDRLVLELDPAASWLIFVRNLVLVGLFAFLLVRLRALPRQRSEISLRSETS